MWMMLGGGGGRGGGRGWGGGGWQLVMASPEFVALNGVEGRRYVVSDRSARS